VTNDELRRRLTSYAILLATISVLLVGGVLALLDRRTSVVVILSSLGVNLMASAAFALVFSLMAGRLQDAMLRETIVEQMSKQRVVSTAEIAQMNSLFLPEAVYPPINPLPNDFGQRFNQDVTDSLIRSNYLYFRGTSAWFLGIRLSQAARKPQLVKVAILDPTDERALTRRVIDRAATPEYVGVAFEQIRRMLIDEIVTAVVAIFDCRQLSPIEIVYDDDSSVYRYEIYESALYLSWFHGPQSTEHELPQSYKFGRESFIYKTLELDFIRRFDAAPAQKRIKFDSSVGESLLLRHLRRLDPGEWSAGRLEDVRAAYANNIADYATFLRGVKGSVG